MKNPIAELDNPDSLKFIKPENADYDNNEINYFCPDNNCLDPERKLNLRKSTLGNLYFSHNAGYDHELHADIILHKLATSEIINSSKFKFPSKSIIGKTNEIFINHSESKANNPVKNEVTPDILLVSNTNDHYYIDINVSSSTNDEKINKAKNENIPLLSIDLQNFYKLNEAKLQQDIDFMLQNVQELVHSNDVKKWTYKPKAEKNFKDYVTKKNVIGAAIVGVAAIITGYFIKKD